LDPAKDHFLQQLHADPNHVRAMAGVGFILLEQGDLQSAQKVLEQAVAKDPENVDAVFDLARTYAREKQSEQAMHYFEWALQLSPDNTQAHYQLFLLYTRNKLPEKAKNELEVFHRLEDLDKMVRREESVLSKARRANSGEANTDEPNVPAVKAPMAPPNGVSD
jgi:tetratricopeptide (TPR) repeat protein